MDVSRSRLVEIIQEWNATRLEMFELSLPDENLEFYGVMRFYYYENGGNIATKCLRVYSTATVSDVVFSLLEKLSSIKIISTNTSYGMCEVHPDGTTRILDMDELPLLLQLTWMKDCIEGRFLLRQSDDFIPQNISVNPHFNKKNGSKNKTKLPTDDSLLAKDLYTKIPENMFTQSISNHEVVMRRKRHQKLDRKLVQISGIDGAPDKGAPMRIYGTLLNPNIPYKTLLLSYKDTADYVVKEMLSKYMLNDKDPDDYALVELVLPPGVTEYSYDDVLKATPLSKEDIPYIIRSKHSPSDGLMLFHVVNRDTYGPMEKLNESLQASASPNEPNNLPFLKQVLRNDPSPQTIFIHLGVTVFGSRPMVSSVRRDFSFVEIIGDNVAAHHAEIHYDNKVVSICPSEKAKLYVNDVPVFDNFVLLHGDTVQFGSSPPFKLFMPGFVEYSTEYSAKKAISTERRQLDKPYTFHNPPLIPADITFKDEDVIVLLRNALNISPTNVSFKLAPAFFVYLLARHYSVDNNQEDAYKFLLNASASFSEIINKSENVPTVLAFWISNTVELLQLLIKDTFLALSSNNILNIFMEACTIGYDELFEMISRDMEQAAGSFFADVDDADPESYGRRNVLERTFDVIGSAIFMMQTNRMHPSITSMFFSELFGVLNCFLVKTVMSVPMYCCLKWGRRFSDRINLLKSFIVIQGLEQSATVHFQLISEIAEFLCILEEGVDFSEINHFTCLNSMQVEHIVNNYTFMSRSHMLSYKVKQQIIHSFIRNVDSIIIRSDKSVVMIQDVDKQPFSLPSSDYYYESMTEMPHEFIDYLAIIKDNNDLCQLNVNGKPVTLLSVQESPDLSKNNDSVHYGDEISRQLMAMHLPLHPEVLTMRLNKLNGTLGISLASARSQTDGTMVIIVDSITKDGAAYLNGRIKPFDQLVMVDSNSLINVNLNRVTQIMMNSSDCVELKIVKSGALYHLPYRLIKNVSPKFHSLLESGYSTPPPVEIPQRSLSPRRELEPVILTPLKKPIKSQGFNSMQRDYPNSDNSKHEPTIHQRKLKQEIQRHFPTENPRYQKSESFPNTSTGDQKMKKLEPLTSSEYQRKPKFESSRVYCTNSKELPVSEKFQRDSKVAQFSRPNFNNSDDCINTQEPIPVNNFLLKLNSVPPRTDSRQRKHDEKTVVPPSMNKNSREDGNYILKKCSEEAPDSSYENIVIPSPRSKNYVEDRNLILRHFSETAPVSSHANSGKFASLGRSPIKEASSPHVARIVSTVPPPSDHSKNVRDPIVPQHKKSEVSEPITFRMSNNFSTTEDIGRTQTAKTFQVPPARVSSLNHSFRVSDLNDRDTRPIIKLFEEFDADKKPKTVTFKQQTRNMALRESPMTEDDYQNVYNSALKEKPEQVQSSQLYNVD